MPKTPLPAAGDTGTSTVTHRRVSHGGDTAGHHCGTKPPGAAGLSRIQFALAGMEGVKLGGNQGPAELHKALGVFPSDGLCEGG